MMIFENSSFLKKREGHAGFTLLEVILSLTILSLVTLVIGGAFRLGLDAWEKGDKEIQSTQKLRALSGLISQNLKSAFPYKMEIEDEDVILFAGDNNYILFVTSLADSAFGGFKWIRYTFKDGALMMAEGILPDKEFSLSSSENEEVVDSSIEEFNFEYLSLSEGEWTEEWELGEDLPAAVRVSIRHYPPFLITLPMSRDIEKEDDEENITS
jgi:general secretion pathway protein J